MSASGLEAAAPCLQHSSRMILRKPTSQDAPAVFAIFGASDTNRFNPAGPHSGPEESEATLRRWLAHWAAHGFGQWTISLKTSQEEIIGFGGLASGALATAHTT
jgi:RimJ/RimL family protein N-acetyltransferase